MQQETVTLHGGNDFLAAVAPKGDLPNLADVAAKREGEFGFGITRENASVALRLLADQLDAGTVLPQRMVEISPLPTCKFVLGVCLLFFEVIMPRRALAEEPAAWRLFDLYSGSHNVGDDLGNPATGPPAWKNGEDQFSLWPDRSAVDHPEFEHGERANFHSLLQYFALVPSKRLVDRDILYPRGLSNSERAPNLARFHSRRASTDVRNGGREEVIGRDPTAFSLIAFDLVPVGKFDRKARVLSRNERFVSFGTGARRLLGEQRRETGDERSQNARPKAKPISGDLAFGGYRLTFVGRSGDRIARQIGLACTGAGAALLAVFASWLVWNGRRWSGALVLIIAMLAPYLLWGTS